MLQTHGEGVAFIVGYLTGIARSLRQAGRSRHAKSLIQPQVECSNHVPWVVEVTPQYFGVMTPGNCSRITVMRRSALRPATSACAVCQGSSRVYQHAALARSSHEGRPHLSTAHGAASSSGRVDAGLTSIPTQQQCSCCDSGHSHQVLMPHPPRHSTEALASRRSMLWLAAAGAAAAAAPAADAAPTLFSIAPPGATSAVSRLIQALPFQLPGGSRLPGPVRFPRKALDQRFAVLLMRSSYDAVNLLDFIPMDQFEVRAGLGISTCGHQHTQGPGGVSGAAWCVACWCVGCAAGQGCS